MVEKKSKKSQKNIFEHLIGQVGLNIYRIATLKLLQPIGTTLNLKPILQHNLSAQQELNVPIFEKQGPDTPYPLLDTPFQILDTFPFLTNSQFSLHQQAN